MRIKDVAALVGISSDTIRRWERAGLSPQPNRDVKGWRLYEEHDVVRLRGVLQRLHEVKKPR